MNENRFGTVVSRKERFIWIVLCLLILMIAVTTISKYEKDLTMAEKNVLDFEKAKSSWVEREEMLNLELTDLRAQLDARDKSFKILPSSQQELLAKLNGMDLRVGQNLIIDDLLKHNDLIPVQGVLGGTMAFLKEEIFVITDKWVIAYFEDGHIGGNMLLEYSISNGSISWGVLAYYLLGQ